MPETERRLTTKGIVFFGALTVFLGPLTGADDVVRGEAAQLGGVGVYALGGILFLTLYLFGIGWAWKERRLGKWVKAAMLLRVREELPEVKVVITGNATINAPMLSINDRLGFKPFKDGIEVQMPLEEVEDFLAKRPSQGSRISL